MKHGTCSLCGGAVTTPDIWHGVTLPTPQCQSCHAIPVQPHGPVIQMQPTRSHGPQQMQLRNVEARIAAEHFRRNPYGDTTAEPILSRVRNTCSS